MRSTRIHKGFTLIETVLVIALVLLLTVISIAALNAFANRSGHTEAAQIVLGALKETHARTLASQNDTRYGTHFASTSVTIFEGGTYTFGDPGNQVYELPSRTHILSVNLSSGTNIFFDRLSGNASPTGTIVVANTSDASVFKTITVYDSGLTEITY